MQRVSVLPLTSFRQERVWDSHAVGTTELSRWAGTTIETPQAGREGSARAACMEKPFSPGNQGEGSDGAAVPVRGNEDRAMCLPIISHFISGPIPSFDWEGNWNIQRRIWWKSPGFPGPPVQSPPYSPCLGQIKSFCLLASSFHEAVYEKGSL